MPLLSDTLQLVVPTSKTLLVELACLGCGGDLTTSKLERAGLATKGQALILLDADIKRAAQRVCLGLKVRSARLDSVDQAEGDGLSGVSASSTSTTRLLLSSSM